jgi:hypothetical protein
MKMSIINRATICFGIITILVSSIVKKIDGSSDEAMTASLEVIRKSLDNEKSEKFDESIQTNHVTWD